MTPQLRAVYCGHVGCVPTLSSPQLSTPVSGNLIDGNKALEPHSVSFFEKVLVIFKKLNLMVHLIKESFIEMDDFGQFDEPIFQDMKMTEEKQKTFENGFVCFIRKY